MKDKYLSYSTSEFVADDEFIAWILEPTEAQTRQWTAWLKDHPQVQSKIDEATDIVKNISFKKIDTNISTADLWAKIDHDLKLPLAPRKTSIVRKLIISGAVAAGLAFLLISKFAYSGYQTIMSDPGETLTHQLPDGSQVVINDGSSISYHKTSFVSKREISLEGEAFFEVEKGTSFTVSTPTGSIEVLGTSFSVFSHNRQLRVFCKTGSVKVKANTSAVILKPGEKTSLLENKTLKPPLQTNDQVNWLQGLYNFDDAPLGQVAAELERQFNIEIRLNSRLSHLKYTGFFQDSNLEEALYNVCWPLKLEATKRGDSTYEIRPAD